MISKEEAIVILDKYLRLDSNADPMCANLKANRTSIEEKEYWWELFACLEAEADEKPSMQIGGPRYFITKEEGNLYELGLWDGAAWKEEYTRYKKKEQATFDWKPVKVEYINSQLSEEHDYTFNTISKIISYRGRDKDTQMVLHQLISSNTKNALSKPRFKYKAVDGIKSKLIISNIGEPINDDHKDKAVSQVVALSFTNGYQEMDATLSNIKKWLRVNNLAGTDNYWIEVEETDTSKDFKEWKLIMKMEIKNIYPVQK